MDEIGQPLEVIHLNTILRGAHLLPKYGSGFLQEDFRNVDALNVLKAYFIDYPAHELITGHRVCRCIHSPPSSGKTTKTSVHAVDIWPPSHNSHEHTTLQVATSLKFVVNNSKSRFILFFQITFVGYYGFRSTTSIMQNWVKSRHSFRPFRSSMLLTPVLNLLIV